MPICGNILLQGTKEPGTKGETTMTFAEMIILYHKYSASTLYLFGFDFHGELYYIFLTFEELAEMAKPDKASAEKGGFNKIRIRSSKEQRNAMAHSPRAVHAGSTANLIENVPGVKNHGHAFEKLMTETFTNETWKRDKVPFYKAPDIYVGKEPVQIKFDDAELTNEKVLRSAIAFKG